MVALKKGSLLGETFFSKLPNRPIQFILCHLGKKGGFALPNLANLEVTLLLRGLVVSQSTFSPHVQPTTAIGYIRIH